MIYLYGDLHRKVELKNLIGQSNKASNNDSLIILGDFGGVWYGDERDTTFMDILVENLPYKYILFLDGNHENFEVLNQYPEVDLFRNNVGHIYKNIYHLKRGNKYVIEGKSFFVLGGASSIDKPLRTEGIDYWKEELPNFNEINHSINTLEENQYSFDYILTHCCSSKTQLKLSSEFTLTDNLTDFFDEIKEKLNYQHWYFGHYHLNKTIGKETCIYRKLVKL